MRALCARPLMVRQTAPLRASRIGLRFSTTETTARPTGTTPPTKGIPQTGTVPPPGTASAAPTAESTAKPTGTTPPTEAIPRTGTAPPTAKPTPTPTSTSTTTESTPPPPNPPVSKPRPASGGARRAKFYAKSTLLALGLGTGYLYFTDTRASAHEWLVPPLLRQLYPDGEDAHHAGTEALQWLYRFGLHPRERGSPDAAGDLQVEVFGHILDNPIGTSAGIDKGAEVPTQLLALGPGIVEVGAVTARPQAGNPRPRVFRLPSQNALINRYGFNSEGAEAVAQRLRERVRHFAYSLGLGLDEEAERIVLDGEAGVPPGSLQPGRLMAVQIAKNKETSEHDIDAVVADYSAGVKHLGKYADIIVVNVSSPNTPGLRTLQNVGPLTNLLTAVVDAVKKVDRKTKPAIMVKVSPDEDTEEQVQGICQAVWQSGVDGVIVGNTTKKRPEPLPKGYVLPAKEQEVLGEMGGYSGPQMFERTLALTKRYRKALDAGPKLISQEPEQEKETKGEDTPMIGDEPAAAVLDKLEPSTEIAPVTTPPTSALVAASPEPTTSATPTGARKVLFATGGIANGHQAKQILDAGASVAMVYTALIYGGVGTITRIKQEIREEKKGEQQKP